MYQLYQIQNTNLNNQDQVNGQQGYQNPNNPNLILIPIMANQNFPQPQQNQNPLLQQMLPQNQIYPQQTESTNYEEKSVFIKEQSFNKQISEFTKILGAFVIWEILSFGLLVLLNIIMDRYNYRAISIIVMLSIITWIILLPLGIYKKLRQTNKQSIILACLIIVQALVTQLLFSILIELYYYYYWDYYDYYYYYYYYYSNFMRKNILIWEIMKTLVTIILIIYLQFRQKEIKQLYFVLLIFALTSPVIYFWGFMQSFLTVLYAFLLTNVLRQISNGRFKIKTNQLLTLILATNYGIFVSFWVED